MPSQWTIASPWRQRERAAEQFGVTPLLAQVLYNRGIIDPDDARIFLNPSLKWLHPPDSLPGCSEAARLIVQHIRKKKRIVIYGDYDVDGITATAILWQLLTLTGTNVDFYIPHRIEEGYGLNSDALQQLHKQGADLVITVDCGITAVEQARAARDAGLKLVITDHHIAGDTLPEADAIVHPAIENGYANAGLCGAGVAFKLAWEIAKHLSEADRVSDEFRAFLLDATSLAALGTIADVVPLTQENRILAKFGMAGLRESKHVGLQALIESAKLADQKLNSEHVGFWLAPRLNAAGRMGHARLAVELLTYADETQAGEIAAFLDQQNRSRQNTEKQIFRQACAMIEEQNLASDARRAIVLASEGWHAGVIGIVASRIVDRFGRPTIMIALDNNKGQGSARSISPFQMHVALERCSHLLEGFGGHAMAAGISIQQDKIEEFTEQFVAHANNMLTARDLLPTLHLDAEAGLEELTEPTVQQLEQLGPFGIGNPKPRFASRPLQLVGEPRLVGNGNKHLQMNLSDGRIRRKAIAFNQADHLQPLLDHRTCRVAFEPMLNHFRGRTSVELKISDVVFES